jgi:putative DNA primase/helicase
MCGPAITALGLADAQKMALFYGEGSNGKGVWINTQAYILGDYAWAAAIETFIDQGKYRKGSDASPDLAALAGRRMVYANEPEENSKFSDGLIKAMTSDEPIGGVRELMKPPFELLVTFTNTVSANNMPRIGTDHGIQRRVQVVPWEVIIPDAGRSAAQDEAEGRGERHPQPHGAGRAALPDQRPAGARGDQGGDPRISGGERHPRPVPRAVRRAGARGDGRRERISPGVRGWQTWAQLLPATGKPWSAKHLNAQMQKKGFKRAQVEHDAVAGHRPAL